MKTVLLDPDAADFEAILARRRALGQDLFDEVWEGTYHMAPGPHIWHGFLANALAVLLAPLAQAAGLVGTGPFNVGTKDDYRVPDMGHHRGLPAQVWMPTAAIVIEVVSPGDESWEKFDFYARHLVDEVCVADPATARLNWFVLESGAYQPAQSSPLLGITVAQLSSQIAWPD